MASDLCLVGCVSKGQFFHCVFSDFIVQQNLDLNALEILSIIVGLKLCGQKGKKTCIKCDNMVSVQVINQGKSRSRFYKHALEIDINPIHDSVEGRNFQHINVDSNVFRF